MLTKIFCRRPRHSLRYCLGIFLLALCLCLLPEAAFAEQATAAETISQRLLAQIDERFDDYYCYYTPEELQMTLEDYNGSFGGIGVTLLYDSEAGYTMIHEVHEDGTAAVAGFAPGDYIYQVDGQDMFGRDNTDVAAHVRGEIGTTVNVVVKRGDELIEATLTRALVSSQTVTSEMLSDLDGILYFYIDQFTTQTFEEFAEQYNNYAVDQDIRGIIIDVRSNLGGDFYSAVNLAGCFLPVGETIIVEQRRDEDQSYLSQQGTITQMPVVILQNRFSASASEILTAALQDGGRAVVLGERSYGKGITQSVMMLEDDAGLRFTRGHYVTASGFDLHKKGITPDIMVTVADDVSSEDYFSLDRTRNHYLDVALDYFAELFAQ